MLIRQLRKNSVQVRLQIKSLKNVNQRYLYLESSEYNPTGRKRPSAFSLIKNTGVNSLFLLQWIFLTQKLNWGLLHCRSVPYQLSY